MDDQIEPDIAEAVHHVANRFGVRGLQDMIELAQRELARAEAALEELSAEAE